MKRFLEAAGFEVKGEVCGCDIVAVRDAEPARLAIVEMKLGLSLDLLLQAVERLRAADEVWLAVPATRRGRDRFHASIGYAGSSVWVSWQSTPLAIGSRCLPNLGLIDRDRISAAAAAAQRTCTTRGDPSPGGSTRQPVMTAIGNGPLHVLRSCRQALVDLATCGA